jgi:hypothetical protein
VFQYAEVVDVLEGSPWNDNGELRDLRLVDKFYSVGRQQNTLVARGSSPREGVGAGSVSLCIRDCAATRRTTVEDGLVAGGD